jgi:hypothetical protein
LNTLNNGGGNAYWQGLVNQFTNPSVEANQHAAELARQAQTQAAIQSPEFAHKLNQYTAINGGDVNKAQYLALQDIMGVTGVAGLPGGLAGLSNATASAADIANNRAALTNSLPQFSALGIPSVLPLSPNAVNYGLNGQAYSVPMDNPTVQDNRHTAVSLNQPATLATTDYQTALGLQTKADNALAPQFYMNQRAVDNNAAQMARVQEQQAVGLLKAQQGNEAKLTIAEARAKQRDAAIAARAAAEATRADAKMKLEKLKLRNQLLLTTKKAADKKPEPATPATKSILEMR